MPGPGETPPHGTRRRYQFRRRPCRCDDCRAANRRYVYSRRVTVARDGTAAELPNMPPPVASQVPVGSTVWFCVDCVDNVPASMVQRHVIRTSHNVVPRRSKGAA